MMARSAVATIAWSPDGTTLAAGLDDGSVVIWPAQTAAKDPTLLLLGLPGSGWAAFYGEHRYRLEGDPAGRFWWSSSLCRFEPGELDGHGVELL
jgi:hypothetical protein